MKASDIRRKVREFRREYGLHEITSENLEDVFAQQGFTIIHFNPVLNDPDIETVINSFNLQDMIRNSNGFLYLDQNHRLVFLNENLSGSERRIVLAHEQGHYCCGHSHSDVVGRNVSEEYEANEFAHYLLAGTISDRLRATACKHRKKIGLFILIALIAVVSGFAMNEYKEHKIFEGEYYVTEHGEKYHLKGCVTIEGHKTRRLTKEDVKSGKYEPCSVCQPGE